VNDAYITSLRSAWAVLLENRVPWYAAADTMFLIAIAVLAVIVNNEVLCRGCSAAVVVLLAF
jgi:hypothetical protein